MQKMANSGVVGGNWQQFIQMSHSKSKQEDTDASRRGVPW